MAGLFSNFTFKNKRTILKCHALLTSLQKKIPQSAFFYKT